MKWSKYIYKVCNGNDYIMLNTLNTAIVNINKETYDRIDSLLLSEKQNEDSDFIALVEMHFIVEEIVDETKEFLTAVRKTWDDNEDLKIVLLGTTGCNFGCSYCYENGINRSLNLNYLVSEQLCEYLAKVLKTNDKIKRVFVLLFGGEPTLRWEQLMYACEKISDVCKNMKVSFETGITTNGYLLTEDRIRDLRKYNCTSIQITLDGPEEIHDRRRMLKNGAPSFRQIIYNMKRVLELECVPSIDLRVNVDKANYKSVERLLEFLSTIFLPQQLNISLGVVSETINECNKCIQFQSASFSQDEAARTICELLPLIEKYKFRIPSYYSFDGICIAKTKNSFVVNPDGKVFYCLSMVGRENLSVGSLGELLKSDIINRTFDETAYAKCVERNCVFLPFCHTGCIFDGVVENNDQLERKRQV